MMTFTKAELTEVEIALMHLRRHYQQLAHDFRCEPVREDIATEYDAKAAQTAALLVKVRGLI